MVNRKICLWCARMRRYQPANGDWVRKPCICRKQTENVSPENMTDIVERLNLPLPLKL